MRRSKGLLSSFIALAVVMIYSFSVYAAPNVNASVDPLLVQQASLTSSGSVSINGNPVQSGVTVVSGSSITTGAGSIAMINIDGLARVTVGPNTTATLTFDSGSAVVRTTCNDMRVSVKGGSATVKLKDGSSKTLTAGQDDYFDSNAEVTIAPGSDVAVNCGRDNVSPGAASHNKTLAFGSIGLLGLLLLGGAATGIAVAVANSGSSGARQPVSGFRP